MAEPRRDWPFGGPARHLVIAAPAVTLRQLLACFAVSLLVAALIAVACILSGPQS